MSKFFVGQRVRVDCPSSKHHGAETVVTATSVRGRDKSGYDFTGVEVSLPCSDPNWNLCVYETHELEPILPEGSAPSEFTFQQLMDSLQEVMA